MTKKEKETLQNRTNNTLKNITIEEVAMLQNETLMACGIDLNSDAYDKVLLTAISKAFTLGYMRGAKREHRN